MKQKKNQEFDIKKIIDENYKQIYDKAEKVAMVMLPIRKSWGYGNEDLGEEIDFIIDEIVKGAITNAWENEDKISWCSSGYYMVMVEFKEKKLDISIYIDLFAGVEIDL